MVEEAGGLVADRGRPRFRCARNLPAIPGPAFGKVVCRHGRCGANERVCGWQLHELGEARLRERPTVSGGIGSGSISFKNAPFSTLTTTHHRSG